MIIGQRHFGNIIGELIRIPARLVIIAVHIDRPQHAFGRRHSQLMFERMPRKDGMALLEIEFHLIFKPVFAQKTDTCGRIIIILMFRGFLRFWFHQNGAFKTNFMFVIDNHVQKPPHMVQFCAQIGVQQGFITFAPPPQNVVFSAKFMRGIDAGFDRCRRKSEHIRIRIGGSPGHPAPMAEHIRGAPKQFRPPRLHFSANIIGDLVQTCQIIGKIALIGANIRIVKTKIGLPQKRKHIKSDIGFQTRIFHRILWVPRPLKRRATKGIAAFPGKTVPISNRKAQVIFQPLTQHHFVGIIMSKRHRVRAVRTFIFYGRKPFKKRMCHCNSFTYSNRVAKWR